MKTTFATTITAGWCALFIGEIAAAGQNWTNTITFDGENFHLASSADGNKLLAGGNFVQGTYISMNAGVTWETNNTPDVKWLGFASSADGTKLVGVGLDNSFAK